MRWSIADRIIHVYGCGSGCEGVMVRDIDGTELLSFGGSPIEVSPSGRFIATYSISWTGDHDFRLYDLMNSASIPHGQPVFTVNGVGEVDRIDGKNEKRITVTYDDAHIGDDETIYRRKIVIDLKQYDGPGGRLHGGQQPNLM